MPLAFTTHGDPDAPAVVLLHAIATNSGMWRKQVPDLARHYRAIAMDMPGHGNSPSIATNHAIQDFAQAVLATLDMLEIEKASFIGLSLGSMIAQRIALTSPERVSALVLSNGVAQVLPAGRDAWIDRIAIAMQDGMDSQVSPTLERWFTPEYRHAASDEMVEVGGWIGATDLPSYVAAAKAIAKLDQLQELSAIRAPTLVLAGDYDMAAPPAAVSDIAKAIAHARFATLPAAHLMNIELGPEYSAVVLNFLEQNQNFRGSN